MCPDLFSSTPTTHSPPLPIPICPSDLNQPNTSQPGPRFNHNRAPHCPIRTKSIFSTWHCTQWCLVPVVVLGIEARALRGLGEHSSPELCLQHSFPCFDFTGSWSAAPAEFVTPLYPRPTFNSRCSCFRQQMGLHAYSPRPGIVL